MSFMKLQHLFAIFPGIPTHVNLGLEVQGVFSDARQVTPQSVFVAIKGVQTDGHLYIPQAIQAGAMALVVSDVSKVPTDFSGLVVQVADARETLDMLSSRFHLFPGQELFCVGITGTNGKTSVTYMTEHILNSADLPTGVIGTINHHLGDQVWPSAMTTPDPVALQKRLREFRDAGAMAVAMEISSHALDQHRADSVPFNTVVFTNLTRDHLDYHKDMESYFKAKERLFTDLMWKSLKYPTYAIVNTDDKYGRRLKVAGSVNIWSYGTNRDADLRFQIKKMDYTLTQFHLKTPAGECEVSLPMSGVHNVMNAVAAIGVGMSAGIPLKVCADAMSRFPGVPGRLQTVLTSFAPRKKVSVFIDYAHSPDALENVLTAIQNVRTNLKSSSKIWTVFGCGGDRDKGKRPLMAQIAVTFSDRVMVTSDNPRTEEPKTIIEEIVQGISQAELGKTQVQADRKIAIETVLQQADDGDVVLIAGKGHEDYQIIGTEKTPFSDYKIAQEILEKL